MMMMVVLVMADFDYSGGLVRFRNQRLLSANDNWTWQCRAHMLAEMTSACGEANT